MPIYHILECGECGKRSEPILLDGTNDGNPTMGGGNCFVCDESWQSCPEGWHVSELEYHGKFGSSSFRRIAPMVICPNYTIANTTPAQP